MTYRQFELLGSRFEAELIDNGDGTFQFVSLSYLVKSYRRCSRFYGGSERVSGYWRKMPADRGHIDLVCEQLGLQKVTS